MSLPELYKRVAKLTFDNSPTVLSALAITGTLTTAYLTGKATFKAAEILGDEAEKRMLHEIPENRVFPLKDKVKLVWVQYVPPAGMALTTIGCIVFANSIGAKRLAGLAAAYSLSERSFREYKEKVVEKLGDNKERAMRDELAQERVTRNPVSGNQVLLPSNDVLFYESFTGRYFKSDMETIKSAMNKINYRMINDMYASLSDFYDEIELPNTTMSGELGWSVEHPMDIHFSTVIAEDGRTPCIVIDYHSLPTSIRNHSFRH